MLIAGILLLLGGWIQFAFANDWVFLFQIINDFQTIIGVVVAIVAAIMAWNSAQLQIQSTKKLEEINERKTILSAYKCVFYELVHNQAIVNEIKTIFTNYVNSDHLINARATENILEKCINQAENVSDQMFKNHASEVCKGDYEIFTEIAVTYTMRNQVHISLRQGLSVLQISPETFNTDKDNKIFNKWNLEIDENIENYQSTIKLLKLETELLEKELARFIYK